MPVYPTWSSGSASRACPIRPSAGHARLVSPLGPRQTISYSPSCPATVKTHIIPSGRRRRRRLIIGSTNRGFLGMWRWWWWERMFVRFRGNRSFRYLKWLNYAVLFCVFQPALCYSSRRLQHTAIKMFSPKMHGFHVVRRSKTNRFLTDSHATSALETLTTDTAIWNLTRRRASDRRVRSDTER